MTTSSASRLDSIIHFVARLGHDIWSYQAEHYDGHSYFQLHIVGDEDTLDALAAEISGCFQTTTVDVDMGFLHGPVLVGTVGALAS